MIDRLGVYNDGLVIVDSKDIFKMKYVDSYICQISDGYMLAKRVDGTFIIVKTGYPYPNTPKSNVEMLQKTLKEMAGVEKDLDWFVWHYDRIKGYLMDCVYGKDILDIQHMLASLNVSELSNVVNIKSGVYYVTETDNYMCVYFHNPNTSNALFNKAFKLFNIVEDDNVQHGISFITFIVKEAMGVKARNIIAENDIVREYVLGELSDIFSIEKEFVVDILSLLEKTPKFVIRNYNFNEVKGLRSKLSSLNHIISQYIYPLIKDITVGVIKKKYNVDITRMYDIVGSYSYVLDTFSTKEYKDIYALVVVTTRMKHGVHIKETDLPESIHQLMVLVEENFFADYATYIKARTIYLSGNVYDANMRDISTECHFDELYKNAQSFKMNIDMLLYGIEPTDIYPNSIIWNLNEYFSEDLVLIAETILLHKNDLLMRVCDIDDIFSAESAADFVGSMMCDIDIPRMVVFDKDVLEAKKTLFEQSITIAMLGTMGLAYIAPEIEDVIGKFNSFGKIFAVCESDGDSLFKDDIIYSIGKSCILYEYTLRIKTRWEDDIRIHLDENGFENFRSACIYDFIKNLIMHKIFVNSWFKFMSYDKIDVSFDVETQRVVCKYYLDDR